jgi:phage gp29-like protein
MATQPQDQPTPAEGELTARDDDFGLLAGPFVKLLLPDDSVLTLRGGDYGLYRETLRDDGCKAPFEQRRLAVTKCEWTVDAGGEDALSKAAADWMREQLQELEWDRITDGMLYARWYGHAVAECLYQPDLIEGKVALADIRVRDRSRFAYANDRGAPFIWSQSQGRFVRLPERKMWTLSTGADHDDSPYGLGLAHYCYWPVFFKRNNIKFWLVFLEKFGMPTAIAKMPPGQYDNPTIRNRVRQAMQAMASETGVILPEGTEFEFLNAVRSGTQDYDTMRAAMDAALAKVIIGQTASTQGTPGRLGNDELQTEVKGELVKADADLVCGSFNRTVVRWLTEWNFPGAKPPKVWRIVDPPEDLDAIATRDKTIGELGWERTDESFTATYGTGYQRKEVPEPLQGGAANPLAQQAAAEFAEIGALAAIRNGGRADQQALLEAAQAFANRYQASIGARVQEILDYAEQTSDYETFRARLREMAAESAPEPLADDLVRGGIVARLMGLLRGQRP